VRGVWMCVRQVDSLYDAGNVLFAATCDTLAPMAAPTDIQRRKLVNEMQSAFHTYAEIYGSRVHVGALTDSEEINRKLILSYGAAFNRILEDDEASEDSVELQDDVFNLTSRGCPKLDIIDLMFACTTGRNLSVLDNLAEVGVSDPILLQLRVACTWCADRIALLNKPQVQGPLHFLPKTVPEISGEDRTRLITDLQKLPDLLHIFGDLLSMYPPENIRRFEKSGWGTEGQLAFYYLIIDHFKLGYPTFSRLLRTMRQVRYSVSPKTRYVHRIGRVRVKRRDTQKSPIRDPLRDLALQRRLRRFFDAQPSFERWAKNHVIWYFSGACAHLQARGETFMTSFPYNLRFGPPELRPPMPTENPDSKA
jgi:hypothetical protein